MGNEDLKEQVLSVIDQGKEIFIFSTADEEHRPFSRYMAIIDFEDDYSKFYLGTHRKTHKIQHLQQNPYAQCMFSTPDFLQVASVSGKAVVTESAEKQREMWEKFPVLAGYLKSPDDPDFALVEFEPEFVDFLDFNRGVNPERFDWKEPSKAMA